MTDTTWADKGVYLKPVSWLKPHPENPREITEDDVRKLAHMIEVHGFNDPIECRESGEILCGHRRRLAAIHLKLTQVPVIIHGGLSDPEAHAYRIAHNRSQEDVKWNRALLSDAVAGLGDLFPPDTLGLEAPDIGKLFDLDRGFQDDEQPETAESSDDLPGPFLRQGETWFIGPATLSVWSDRPESIRKVEGLIAKMEKWLKAKATLGSEDGPTFAATIAERAMGQGEPL